MDTTTQSTNENDYAVAGALNFIVNGMILVIYLADKAGVSKEIEIIDLNKTYIRLVGELEKLYDNQPKLSSIEPEPIWKQFDVLKSHTQDIIDYISKPDTDYGQVHYAKVEKLCILANDETPTFTAEQNKLVDHAKKIVSKYDLLVEDAFKKIRETQENNWQIPAYTITYKPDGTILINNILKLKKAHAGSTTERLIEQALNNPNTLFTPDLGQTSRNISTVLHSAGFTPTLRQLFFPTVSKSKGILFRPLITREQADAEKINTLELDMTLKDLGVATEPKMTN